MESTQYVIIGDASARAKSEAHGTRRGRGWSSYDGSGGSESAVKLSDAMMAEGEGQNESILRAHCAQYKCDRVQLVCQQCTMLRGVCDSRTSVWDVI